MGISATHLLFIMLYLLKLGESIAQHRTIAQVHIAQSCFCRYSWKAIQHAKYPIKQLHVASSMSVSGSDSYMLMSQFANLTCFLRPLPLIGVLSPDVSVGVDPGSGSGSSDFALWLFTSGEDAILDRRGFFALGAGEGEKGAGTPEERLWPGEETALPRVPGDGKRPSHGRGAGIGVSFRTSVAPSWAPVVPLRASVAVFC